MVEAVTPPNPADPSDSTRSVPDPTLLTIDSIRREIAMQENLTEVRFELLKELLVTMIDDAEKIRNERLTSVDRLMDKAEEQRREQKADTAAAVDAALQSQIEATAKMEKSISDQIDGLRRNFETSIAGVQSGVADLKERMTKTESREEGHIEQKTEARQVTAGQIALIGIAVTILLFGMAVFTLFAGGGG